MCLSRNLQLDRQVFVQSESEINNALVNNWTMAKHIHYPVPLSDCSLIPLPVQNICQIAHIYGVLNLYAPRKWWRQIMSSPKVLLKQYNFQSLREVLPGERSEEMGNCAGKDKNACDQVWPDNAIRDGQNFFERGWWGEAYFTNFCIKGVVDVNDFVVEMISYLSAQVFASILITCCIGGGVAAPASHSIPEASFAVGEELPLQVGRKKPLLSFSYVTSSHWS